MAIARSVTELIGNTPMVALNHINDTCAEIAVKLEFFNPAASVKDRVGLAIIEQAQEDGRLKPGGTIVEASSGNTGIGLAMVAAARGYRLIVTMPESMSAERRDIITAFGAELVLTPASQGMQGAVDKAEQIAAEQGAILAHQFDTPANPRMHYRTTGPEIWKDCDGKVDIFVAGFGTGGTLSGVGRYLKEQDSSIRVIAVEPQESPLLSQGTAGPHKIQGIGANFIPDNLDRSIVDEVIQVASDEAIAYARQLARKEGIFAGISAGANIAAAMRLARQSEEGTRIVTVAPDTGERYLSGALGNR